jgi:hypothetical protein
MNVIKQGTGEQDISRALKTLSVYLQKVAFPYGHWLKSRTTL